MRRPKVMLLTPPYHSGVVEAAGVWLPLNLAYVAEAARRAGAEVVLCDAMSRFLTHAEIAREIEAFAPDVLGVTAITATEPDAREVCRTAKALDPRTLTVLGNVHPTFCWQEILREEPAVDVVVRGEGEGAFADLVQAVAAGDSLERVGGLALRVDGRPATTADRPFATDLDAVRPAWDLLDWSLYHYRPHPGGRLAIVSTSRGCRQQCAFCSQQRFWERTWRARAPEAVVAELELLRDRFDVQVAMLSDETPTVDRARWERLLDLLIERRTGVELLMETRVDDVLRDEDLLPRYVQAGVSHVYVGVESVEQATLDLFKKETRVADSKRALDLLNAHGIVTETSFVLGTLDETPESIRRTVELATWYAPDMAFFLALAPWPYADLYPLLAEHVVTRDYRRYNLIEPVVKPRTMTIEQLRGELFRASGTFFMDKFSRLDALTPAKRGFLLKVLKLLVEHSYLGAEMKKMAGASSMPPAVRTLVERLGRSSHGEPPAVEPPR